MAYGIGVAHLASHQTLGILSVLLGNDDGKNGQFGIPFRIGGFNHLEKYKSMGRIIPYIRGNNVPNHPTRCNIIYPLFIRGTSSLINGTFPYQSSLSGAKIAVESVKNRSFNYIQIPHSMGYRGMV